MTVYLFDAKRAVKYPIAPEHLTELVHEEASDTLRAAFSASYKPITGEYIGFRCVDGHFRLFVITDANHDDQKNITEIKALDAIVDDLQDVLIEELKQLDVDLHTAINALLPADGWQVTGINPEAKEKSRAYFSSAWEMLKTFETLYNCRITQYYQFDNGAIANRVIETSSAEGVFRGRILESRKEASNVYIAKTGRPITRLYGLGPAQGSQDVQTNMTFAETEWVTKNGDPADKPKGQTWVEDPEAVDKYGLHTRKVLINDAKDEKELLQKTWERLQQVKEPSATCTANVADMEMLPGQSWRVIRLNDLVVIQMKDGTDVVAKIIDVHRDYIRHALTKITAGDKKASIKNQVSTLITNATHTFERLTIYQNRFHEDEALIQMNAEFIQLNAEAIEENAKQIRLNAEELITQANLIYTKADKVDLQATTVRIDAMETEILGLLKAEELEAAIASLGDLHVGGDVNVPGNITADGLWVNGVANLEGGISTDGIEAAGISCTSLAIDGNPVYKQGLTVVTGIDVITSIEGRITAVQPVTTRFYYYT